MTEQYLELWEIWAESAKISETSGDLVLLECLEAGNSKRIFQDLPDDKIKLTLSLINSILNNPKTRPKGLTLLSDFLGQVSVSRLIGFQDAITSGLHLVIKGLEYSSACMLLVNFLPKCHLMSGVHQAATSEIIPKILSHICEDGKNSKEFHKTTEEMRLVKVCLETYHGPCGPFRERLEKVMVPLVDSDDEELIKYLGKVFPMLSFSGGGGSGGEKHINDWSMMLNKFLTSAYKTFCQLYGDSFHSVEIENQFDGDCLVGFKKILGSDTLLSMSHLKRRLCNLLSVISGYLRSSFPVPKQIRQRATLTFVQAITSTSPVTVKDSTKVVMKEIVFLTAITSPIHMSALKVLRNLILSVGSNIFVDGVIVEQILASEFKWIQERPRAYEKFRAELYETLATWLTATGGMIINSKYLPIWINVIGNDTQVEKDVIELKVLKEKKPGKFVKTNYASQSTKLKTSSAQAYVEKSSSLCQVALSVLNLLIPALDAEGHTKVLEHLIKTAAIIGCFEPPPSPYEDPICRLLLYKNLATCCVYPNPKSPISISLVVSLLRNGTHDPTKMVSSVCNLHISVLERVIHPVAAPLSFSDSTPAPVMVLNLAESKRDVKQNGYIAEENMIGSASGLTDENNRGHQTLEDGIATTNSSFTSSNPALIDQSLIDQNALQKIIQNAISEILEKTNVARTSSTNQSDQTRNNNLTSSQLFQNNDFNPVHEEQPIVSSVVLVSSPQNNLDIECDSLNSFQTNHVMTNGTTNEEDMCDDTGIGNNGLGTTEFSLSNNVPPVSISNMDVVMNNDDNISPQKMQKEKRQDFKKSEEIEGPSVDEMMSSFIDLEPIS